MLYFVNKIILIFINIIFSLIHRFTYSSFHLPVEPNPPSPLEVLGPNSSILSTI